MAVDANLRDVGHQDFVSAYKRRSFALRAKVRVAWHDTVDANLMLNLPADARRYDMVSIMLDHLNIQQVRLITNNPLRVRFASHLALLY